MLTATTESILLSTVGVVFPCLVSTFAPLIVGFKKTGHSLQETADIKSRLLAFADLFLGCRRVFLQESTGVRAAFSGSGTLLFRRGAIASGCHTSLDWDIGLVSAHPFLFLK